MIDDVGETASGGCEPTEAVHGIRLSGLEFDRLCGGS